MKTEVNVNEVVLRFDGGSFYEIKGNLVNGYEVELGEVSPRLYETKITRRINHIDFEKKRLYCECGRVFVIDKDLKLFKCNY